LAAKKGFGQNFLVDAMVTRAIAEACVPDDERGRAIVVELGAGLGALTSLLLERAARVIAVERDRDLVPILAQELETDVAAGRLAIAEADAQTFDLEAAFASAEGAPRVLCGNLPYQITGRLLQRAVEHASGIDRAVFMVQREVADRLLAEPGSKTYGALTIFTRAAFDVTRVRNVSPGCFHPAPDVTSTVVRLLPCRPVRAVENETFRALVKRAFEARRKTLRNAWSSLGPERVAVAAEHVGIALERRGETLDVTEYAKMAAALDAAAPATP
jgi:16S rRNA (adenine1518-N6/adenine1519-N6)-dimethyltransferase